MAIRVEHQAVGALGAAYAAGVGKARERRRKYTMAMLKQGQQQQRRLGNRYRTAMSSTRGGQKQIEGTWEDPLVVDQTFAKTYGDPSRAITTAAQQEANARADRLKKPRPYPEAEKQFTPAKTKEQIKHGWDLEEEEREREREVADEGLKARRATGADELDWWQQQDVTSAAEIDRIRKVRGDAFRDTGDDNVTGRWATMNHELGLLAKDETLTPLEKHQLATQIRQKFLAGFDEDQHIIPREEREGNVRTNNDGIKQTKTPEGKWENVGLVDEGMMTKEQVDAGESKNWRKTPLGTYQERVLGTGGVVQWEDKKLPEDPATKVAKEYWDAFDKVMKLREPVGGWSNADWKTTATDVHRELKEERGMKRPVIQPDSEQGVPDLEKGGVAPKPTAPPAEEPAAPPAAEEPVATWTVPAEPPAVEPAAEPAAQPPTQQPASIPASEVQPAPIQITGKPIGATGKAAETLKGKGLEYVATVNSQGKRTGQAWRPRPPMQTLHMKDGESHTGHVYHEGDKYFVRPPGEKALTIFPSDDVERIEKVPATSSTGQQPAGSAKDRAVAAARAGDANAQRALDERGIPWQP